VVEAQPDKIKRQIVPRTNRVGIGKRVNILDLVGQRSLIATSFTGTIVLILDEGRASEPFARASLLFYDI